MKIGILLFSLLCLLLKFSITFALSKGRAISLSATRVEILQDGTKILAEGDIVVEQDGHLLYAGRVIYNRETEFLELFHFKLFDFIQNATVSGDHAFFDLRNDEIISDKAFLFLKRDGIRIKAWEFSKNALNEYRAKRAIISTCEFDCEKEEYPPWSIEVKDFLLTPEGINTVKAIYFRVKDLPLLYSPQKVYLPKITLPVFEQRKRGFLFPHIALGNRIGMSFQFPYFIPLTDQIDFTLSPLYSTKRGFLLDFENQIVLTKDTKAFFLLRYLKDIKASHYVGPGTPKHRYWTTGKVDISTGKTWDLHLDLDLLSDKGLLEEFNIGEGSFDRIKRLYIERFNRDIEDKAQDLRTSKIWVQYQRNSLYTRLQSAYIDYEGLGNRKEVLQPLAHLRSNLLPINIAGVLASIALDYNYFYRKENYYGSRIGLNTEIGYPFSFSLLKSEAKVNLKNYFYLLEDLGNFTRRHLNQNLLEFSINSYSLLYRNYELGDSPLKIRFQHILKPYIKLFLREISPQREKGPLLTYEDYLVKKAKTLEYGLWQFVHLPNQKNFLIIKAYQQYDFSKVERSPLTLKPEERALSDLYLHFFSQWQGRFVLRYDTAYNFYGYGFKKHSLNIGLIDLLLNQINLTYQEDEAWKTRQVTFSLSHLLAERLGLHYYISRNLIRGEISEQRLEAQYLHECYLLGVGMSVTPKDTKFYFRINLRGLGGIADRTIALP